MNLLLVAILACSALGLVTSTHKARALVAKLEQERSRARQLEIEYGQLQIEQKRLANLARVESVALERLKMRAPDARRTRLVPLAEAPAGSGGAAR